MKSLSRTFRLWCLLSLGVLILTRLVWLQTRPSTPIFAPKFQSARVAGDSASLQMRRFCERLGTGGFEFPLSNQYIRRSAEATLCHDSLEPFRQIVHFQQILVILSASLNCFMVWILTRSWAAAMIGVVVLLSRGTYLSHASHIGRDVLLGTLSSLFFASLALYFRTTARLALGLAVVWFAFTCGILNRLVDQGFALLTLLLASMLWARYLPRKSYERWSYVFDPTLDEQRGILFRRGVFGAIADFLREQPSATAGRTVARSYRSPSILRPIMLPFSQWLSERKRAAKLVMVVSLVTAVAWGAFAPVNADRFSWNTLRETIGFVLAVNDHFDWHLRASLGLIVFYMLWPGIEDPLSLRSFCWAFFAIFCFDFMVISPKIALENSFDMREHIWESWIFLWQPPLVFLAVAGTYRNLQLLGTRVFR